MKVGISGGDENEGGDEPYDWSSRIGVLLTESCGLAGTQSVTVRDHESEVGDTRVDKMNK